MTDNPCAISLNQNAVNFLQTFRFGHMRAEVSGATDFNLTFKD